MRGLWLGVLLLAGCYPPSGGGGGGGLQACPEVIQIQGFAYHPSQCFVARGASVRFQNQDSVPHTATAENGSFNTGTLNPGQTSDPIALNQLGTHPYFCTFHPGMRGSIEVR
ncbi:hypothetical protein FJNA_03440 [Thermus sp. FJN-A]